MQRKENDPIFFFNASNILLQRADAPELIISAGYYKHHIHTIIEMILNLFNKLNMHQTRFASTACK